MQQPQLRGILAFDVNEHIIASLAPIPGSDELANKARRAEEKRLSRAASSTVAQTKGRVRKRKH